MRPNEFAHELQATPCQPRRTQSFPCSHHTVKPIASSPPDSSRRGLDGGKSQRRGWLTGHLKTDCQNSEKVVRMYCTKPSPWTETRIRKTEPIRHWKTVPEAKDDAVRLVR